MTIQSTNDTKNYYKHRYDYLPIIIVLIYLNFTYFLHLFMNYPTSIRGLIFIFVITLSVLIGYLLPNDRQSLLSKQRSELHLTWENGKNINKIISGCAFIVIIYSFNNITSYYSGISEILYYATNPGQAYEYTKFIRRYPELNTVEGGLGSTLSILLTLTASTRYIYLTLSLLYWNQLKRITKVISLIATGTYLLHSFLMGAMITIAGLILALTPVFIILLRARKPRVVTTSKTKVRSSKKWKMVTIIVISMLVILFFVSNRIEENSSLLTGVKTLGFYLSHGYIGLEHSLEMPFEFTYGFTTFRSVSSYLVKYLGAPDYFQNSYLVRNEIVNGWPALSVWSTIFPWLASDFTFYLIPFIMGFISYKFSLIWNKTMSTGNPYGYLLLGQLFIFWFMIPANNQLFHTLENMASFIMILILYKRSKLILIKKYKRKQRNI